MDRREFLRNSTYCGLALAFGGPLTALRAHATTAPGDQRWEGFYRDEFLDTRGDAQGFAFHCSNCQGNCAWKVFAKDGRVTREEQSAAYPQIHPRIPDANPRGCNKGIVHSREMYQGDRLLHPLKRVGERGEGKWERVSWEEALEDIATRVVGTLTEQGPGELMIYAGTGILSQGRRAGPLRLGSLLGAQRLYPASAVGDMFTGASLAYGLANTGHSLDAWFDADAIFLWAINPIVTRIPDAHYLNEARYNGATIYTISPDYNPSCKFATHWVPIKPGTDAYLAMSLLHVLLRDGHVDDAFVREQTDLPFLVREDSGELLRHRDLRARGKEDVFYCWDEASGKEQPMPGTPGHFKKTLRLGKLRPALGGRYEVKGKEGELIPVTTVFERVRAEAANYPPDETQAITGIHPELVERMARDLARSDKAIINIGFALHKYVSGTMSCWAAALACALTGHAGERGGIDTEHNWSLNGIGPLSSPKPARFASGFFSEWLNGDMQASMDTHYSDEHLKATVGYDSKDVARQVAENRESGKAYYGKPKALLLFADNMFRRNKTEAHHREALLSNLDIFVDINHRMDSTALWADYVLPAKSHYESWDIRGELGYHRFCNVTIPPEGLKPVGETRSEWTICRGLSEAMAKVAKARGIEPIPDPDFLVEEGDMAAPVMRDLQTLPDDFTDGGTLNNDEDVVRWLMENVEQIAPWTPEDARKNGFVILNEKAGFTSPLYANRPYHSFERNVYLREPYKTHSGRQQFFVDHPVFKEHGWTVPTAMGPLRPPSFPLAFYTPHTRWGIHSQWRTNAQLLRLQRGEPYLWLNPATAAAREVGEDDRVRVFNDVGEFIARVKLMPAVPPEAVVMDHAWEPHQFEKRIGLNSTVAGMISLLELPDGWGHLTFSPNWDGNMIAHESSVEVEKA
ncbi:molybdopterin-dependent oxidoreductase [Thiohalomonas denitrificans]|uniref:Complex iron-sulfur molybdoenzyme family reductase subunit alpha n=1 Tax=Thiohalomonas denitrificans TaxID=415747 RepID=A0A1G5Q9H9_9GAMM|nr:molybdopterin-dependent oxidoreductase [Thiohalomonas denitrificans]SCZ58347.1 complex iron-sulfur molybdoenzyme family reductase subunit alpha [Thiohalomonas denitrificans]